MEVMVAVQIRPLGACLKMFWTSSLGKRLANTRHSTAKDTDILAMRTKLEMPVPYGMAVPASCF
jgi:hypothetical protein